VWIGLRPACRTVRPVPRMAPLKGHVEAHNCHGRHGVRYIDPNGNSARQKRPQCEPFRVSDTYPMWIDEMDFTTQGGLLSQRPEGALAKEEGLFRRSARDTLREGDARRCNAVTAGTSRHEWV